jgi:hypothetical protein
VKTGRRAAIPLLLSCVVLAAAACSTQPPLATQAGRSEAPATGTSSGAQALSAIACASLQSTPVYEAVNPADGRSLLTTSAAEASKASSYGFTTALGVSMHASRYADIPGLVAIHRMSSNTSFAWVTADRVNAMTVNGYTDQGVNFYASPLPSPCTKAVTELSRAGVKRYSADRTQTANLVAGGWVDQGVAYYVGADPVEYGPATSVGATAVPDRDASDPEFSFAAIPDTQIEVHSTSDSRLGDRSEWLVANRRALDLRFAVQIGDLVDWDTPDHEQYVLAQKGLRPMVDAGLPHFLNIGNHDGQATCDGGGACDNRFTTSLVRMTEVFNQYFPASDFGAPVGEFEPGKVDNTYTTIGAGGTRWLLLNLELWPRKSVIAWAEELVKSHPRDNVIVATHAFLDGNGEVDSQPNYGSTTSAYLLDHLIAAYPNVKMVLCGHTGQALTKVLRGRAGNKIFVFLQAFHSPTTNPVRLVRVNVARQTITTWVEAPATNEQLIAPQTYPSAGIIG